MRSNDYSPWIAQSTGAQAINRAAVVLRILAISGGAGITIGEISEIASLPKSTVHRLLSALVDERLAERARDTRRYRLGMEVLALGAAAGPKHDLRSIARPAMEMLAHVHGFVAHLMIRSGYDAVCLDQEVPAATASMIGVRGSRAPLGVGANSLAILSYLNDDEIEDAMTHNRERLQGHPVFGVDALLGAVRTVRRQGYSVASIKQNPPVFGVGVPILAGNRRPFAAIGITTLDGAALDEEAITAIAQILKQAARQISRDYEAIHEKSEEGWLQAGHTDR